MVFSCFSTRRNNYLAVLNLGGLGWIQRIWRLLLPGILVLMSAMVPGRVYAAEVAEYQIKVAYLFNFTHFVEWPATAFDSSDSFFRICVIGTDSFGGTLTSLTTRNHQGHPIVIKYPTSVREARRCHILYIGPSKNGRELDILDSIDSAPVLTVSSLPNFVERGGVIGFIREANHIRFAINHTACKHVALMCSAKLLEVALRVVDIDSRKERR